MDDKPAKAFKYIDNNGNSAGMIKASDHINRRIRRIMIMQNPEKVINYLQNLYEIAEQNE